MATLAVREEWLAASRAGERARLRELARREPGLVNFCPHGGNTALIEAILRGDVAQTQWLLEQGADVEKKGVVGHPLTVVMETKLSVVCLAAVVDAMKRKNTATAASRLADMLGFAIAEGGQRFKEQNAVVVQILAEGVGYRGDEREKESPARKAASRMKWAGLDILAICALKDPEIHNHRRIATLVIARKALAEHGDAILPGFCRADERKDLIRAMEPSLPIREQGACAQIRGSHDSQEEAQARPSSRRARL